MTTVDSNRRMRENRMSGGVGGVTGAIPLPRPDQRTDHGCRIAVGARPDGRYEYWAIINAITGVACPA